MRDDVDCDFSSIDPSHVALGTLTKLSEPLFHCLTILHSKFTTYKNYTSYFEDLMRHKSSSHGINHNQGSSFI